MKMTETCAWTRVSFLLKRFTAEGNTDIISAVNASHLLSGQNKGFALTTSPEAFLMGDR